MRYTARRKLALLVAAKRLQGEGRSLRSAVDKLCVSIANLSRWAEQKINKVDPMDSLFTKKKKAVHPGLFSQLIAIEEPLLRYIFKLRKQGQTIDMFVIMLRALYITPEFREKSFIARCSAEKQFCYAHSMTYRMGMQTLQRPPAEIESEALNFMRFMRQIVFGSNCDRRYILNMDQTPVYFLMNAKHTLELIGKKTVHIRTSSDDTKQVTIAVTIAAVGTVLPLMLIFKGQPGGRIEKTDFATYPATHHYQCQANEWMDEVCMIVWVNEVLGPYVATAPDDVVPLLVLDSYQCHKMASVVQMIQELGVEVKHIPEGCTPLCQPVDVGFNKPFNSLTAKSVLAGEKLVATYSIST